MNGQTRSLDLHGLVRKAISRIARAENLDQFRDTTAREVRDLTGFDRVMVYKFHPDFQDEVVAASKREEAEFQIESTSIFCTDSPSTLYPAARERTAIASGLLALPVSTDKRDVLMWFRTETIHTIHWAGNPSDKPTIIGLRGLRLTPRRSFELYRDSVRSRSLPWLDVERDTAQQLRRLLGETAVPVAEPLAATERDKLPSRMNRLLDGLKE